MRYRGQNQPFDPKRKVRTREHVIADLSYNYLKRFGLNRGHWLDAPNNDYGIDAIMFHHNAVGEIENGEVRFQLKATDGIDLSGDENWIPKSVEIKDLRYWYFDPYPIIAVLYDAIGNCAYWLDVQQYVDQNPQIMDTEAASATLRIPTENSLTNQAIDFFRDLSRGTVVEITKNRSFRTTE